jgi:hypothetical protein
MYRISCETLQHFGCYKLMNYSETHIIAKIEFSEISKAKRPLIFAKYDMLVNLLCIYRRKKCFIITNST